MKTFRCGSEKNNRIECVSNENTARQLDVTFVIWRCSSQLNLRWKLGHRRNYYWNYSRQAYRNVLAQIILKQSDIMTLFRKDYNFFVIHPKKWALTWYDNTCTDISLVASYEDFQWLYKKKGVWFTWTITYVQILCLFLIILGILRTLL